MRRVSVQVYAMSSLVAPNSIAWAAWAIIVPGNEAIAKAAALGDGRGVRHLEPPPGLLALIKSWLSRSGVPLPSRARRSGCPASQRWRIGRRLRRLIVSGNRIKAKTDITRATIAKPMTSGLLVSSRVLRSMTWSPNMKS